MIGILSRNLYPLKSELFELLPMLCLNESNELEPELARDCMSALSVMSGSLISPELVPLAVEGVTNVCKSQSWKAKVCGLEFLQVQIFTNFAVFLCCPPTSSQALIDTVTSLLQDPQLEVREKAGTVLGGLVHCGFITSEQRAKMTADFICAANKKLKKWKGAEGSTPEDKAAWQNRHNQALIKRHAGVLGLCSVVSACPYDIPDHLPEVLIVLGDHLHDPNPIPATVKRVLQDFKRTHQDNWTEHKERFTEDQLNMLTDLLVSPSYYA
jgi:proteasome activator subunit 4